MLLALIFPALAALHTSDIDSVEKEVFAMRPETNVWRELQWETCLLDGLAESRKQDKPVLLWVFLHNPNEERC